MTDNYAKRLMLRQHGNLRQKGIPCKVPLNQFVSNKFHEELLPDEALRANKLWDSYGKYHVGANESKKDWLDSFLYNLDVIEEIVYYERLATIFEWILKNRHILPKDRHHLALFLDIGPLIKPEDIPLRFREPINAGFKAIPAASQVLQN